MARREEFKIYPQDLKKNTGIGISLPLNGNSVFNITYSTAVQVKSNLINLLLTNRGERPFNPNFHTDLRRVLFENRTDTEELKNIISNKINLYIPQITLNDVSILNLEDHKIQIKIDYSVNKKEDTVTVQFQ